jgi:hypothetical protein
VNTLNSPLSHESIDDPPLQEFAFNRATARIFNPSMLLTNLLWILTPLTIAIFLILAYIPTLSSLGISKTHFQGEPQAKRFHLPIRGYTIPINRVQIRVSRKLSSLRGLMLREMNFTLSLPLDYSDKKRIFDFLTGEKIKYTKTDVLLQKTVDIRNIPLLIVRMRALLGTTDIKNYPLSSEYEM